MLRRSFWNQAQDIQVWEFARDNDFFIVTKDADFSGLSVLLGSPPKIIWLRTGNCSTHDIETLLRVYKTALESLEANPDTSIIELI